MGPVEFCAWVDKLFKPNDMENLRKRKGFVTINIEAVRKNIAELLALYSVFYPVDIDHKHRYSPFDTIILWGYSEHFDETEEGEAYPEYYVFLNREDDKITFDHFEKVN